MAANGIDLDYVAELARIELSDEQKKSLSAELGNIVDYIAELSEVDVTGVEPTAHATAHSNMWREDVVSPSFDRKTMLAGAPGVIEENLIRLPKVMPGTES